MRKRLELALSSWVELRDYLRKRPLLDYTISVVLVSWGISALTDPASIVVGSKFFPLGRIITPLGAAALVAGLWQAWAAHTKRLRQRQVSSHLGFFILITFMCNVQSRGGHIAWGAWTFIEGLIAFSLLVP